MKLSIYLIENEVSLSTDRINSIFDNYSTTYRCSKILGTVKALIGGHSPDQSLCLVEGKSPKNMDIFLLVNRGIKK